MKVDLSPAKLERRVMAGAFDGVVVLLLCAAYFLVPVMLLGVVLPMWGVLAAIIGYSVIPLAVFRQTPGMRLFGIELVSREGHAVNVGDLLFRELLGRGWFPAAFLFNLVFSYVAMMLGYARFAMPAGMQFIFVMACSLALLVAVLGHLLVLGMTDRRSIADMMAKSWVVPQQVRPLPEDADELADARSARRRSVRNVVIAEVLVLAFGLGAPWVLTRKTESTEQRTARLLRGKLEAQFKANHENESVAYELARAYRAAGDDAAADKVVEQHEAAVNAARAKRLADQLQALDQNPGDEVMLLAALEELERQGRLDDAKLSYARFIEVRHDAEYRAGYADWLSQKGFGEEGIALFRTLVKEEPDYEGIHKFLARALVRAGELEAAQEEYQRELVLDPEDEDALDAMEELNTELGPLPKAKVAAIAKELKAPKR